MSQSFEEESQHFWDGRDSANHLAAFHICIWSLEVKSFAFSFIRRFIDCFIFTCPEYLMKTQLRWGLIMLCLGCCAFQAQAVDDSVRFQAGSYSYVLRADDRERSFLLHIPSTYDGRKPFPLILMLHGRTGSGRSIEKYSGMSEIADAHECIVAYPDALGFPTSWNTGFDTDPHQADDVAFLHALLLELQKKLSLDGARIFVAGHSSGALMAYRMGAGFSETFAAIGAVAGSIGRTEPDGHIIAIPEAVQPVSVIAFHGRKDEYLPYDTAKRAIVKYGYFLPVADAMEYWIRRNGCASIPKKEVSSSGNIVKETYSGGKKGTEVVLYTIQDGNHRWPGDKTTAWFQGRANAEISATQLIWEFFDHHPKQP